MRDRKADNPIRKQLWLEQCAWANRRVMPPSELRLWSALKARKLGVQFRREVPLLGCFIVDFCAPSVRLVVEVDGAAHLTDEVIPEVPLRQWVLSVPYELRLLLARYPHVITAEGRIFVQEIFRWQRERAGLSGLRSTASGAVCFPQRFGGSMNLNVHFHVAVPDGVFTATKGAARAEFWRLPTPDRMDVETLTVNVGMRVVGWRIGIEALHRELHDKNYKYMNPGLT